MISVVEMFQYDFIVKAIIIGTLVSICAALLGVILIQKRYAMIGDGLSHVGFGALAIATVLNISPLQFSIPTVVIIAFFLLRLNEKHKIKGDSAIALISASSMAIGVMVISLTIGMNIDICNYLFGSILAIKQNEVILSIVISILVIITYFFFYNKIFTVTYDEEYARATGIKTNRYHFLIAVLTSLTIVLGMRIMGSLLISSLIIFPTITSMQLFKSFKQVTISSVIISIISFFIGFYLSYEFASPTGASIVSVNMIILIIIIVITRGLKLCRR